MTVTLYPARVTGTMVAHLARTEARTDDVPALFAVCPAGGGGRMGELELIPAEDEDRIVWCPDCRSYKTAITERPTLTLAERAGQLEETNRIARGVAHGTAHPTPAAPEGIWLEGGRQPLQGPV